MTVTVLPNPSSENIALESGVVVTANAENLPNQAAIKAINGVAQGFPVDSTQEWAATNNPFPSGAGGTDAFLRLDWPSSFVVSSVVLFDRPNSADRVTGGRLTFSDGSSVNVGALPNNGAPRVVNFSPRQISWLRFDVDAVSSSTNNVGLAELEVNGTPGCLNYPSVSITSPQTSHFQTSSSLEVTTNACFDSQLHAGWGVRFIVDGGPGSGGSEFFEFTAPFSANLTSLSQAEHTIEVQVVDQTGTPVIGSLNEDQVSDVGIGDYYVAIGDSITFGTGDFLTSDNTSADGRNATKGFTPILVDLLADELGFPNFIANEGVPGDSTSDGIQNLPSVVAAHPQATNYLIKFGNNDTFGIFPRPSGVGLSPGNPGYPGSFKDLMQQIIDGLPNGVDRNIAKITVTLGDSTTSAQFPDPVQNAPRNLLIQEYNTVIDELIAIPANNVSPGSPDFFNEFIINQRYETEYDDNIHPNGIGYQRMGDLWLEALTNP